MKDIIHPLDLFLIGARLGGGVFAIRVVSGNSRVGQNPFQSEGSLRVDLEEDHWHFTDGEDVGSSGRLGELKPHGRNYITVVTNQGRAYPLAMLEARRYALTPDLTPAE